MSLSPSHNILIGDLLVRSEMASQTDMAGAIPVSLKTGLPVGRVLVAANALSEKHLQQALLAQSLIRDSLLSADLAIQALRIVLRENFSLEQALTIVGWQPETFSEENRLGQLLLAATVITELQLDDALRIFYSTGLPLARILVRKGIISNLVAYAALSSQQLLRDNKLSRDQAITALRAAATSNAVIQDDYVNGYLRMCPPNHLRLGELLILAQLISEEVLIKTVENALQKGETLGEMLVSIGAVRADTMERALEAQRLVTKGILDISRAGDVLRKANFERMSVAEALEKDAPAVLVSSTHVRQPEPSVHPRLEEARFTATLRDLPLTGERKQRSQQETRARQFASRLLDKLEALHVRNKYLINIIDKDAKAEDNDMDLYEVKRQIELVANFDDSMEVIDRLMARIETCAYQNGFLRARLDAMTTEADLREKLNTLEQKKPSARSQQPSPVPDDKQSKSKRKRDR